MREVREEMKETNEPTSKLLESLFDCIIAEDIDDQNSSVGGSDNMSAILIELNLAECADDSGAK